ncbi:MAG: SpoIIE family protein phosphatase [candidate division Zixibacteria bacterium]|nr:SpoIIE family protein phosphatase [candidate division Zixibacteria bacterium]MBU1469988.1 SpoIIE family protein phosphatase [candidate division Zixibacteria bacterium]MBU2626168.1 SpoIIE family protein phosphatase [candidate division Zixibacteria bacterium]
MSYQLLVSIILFISSVLLLFTGTVVLRDNPRRRLNRITGLMLILVGLGPLFAALGNFFTVDTGGSRPQSAIVGLSLLWELFFPQLVLFSMTFPVERQIVTRHRKARFLIFIPHVFHVILATLFYDPDKIIRWLSVDDPPQALKWLFDQFALGTKFLSAIVGSMIKVHLEFFAVVNLVYVLIASALLYSGYKTVTNQRLRTQTSIVIWGVRISVGLYVLAFILPNLGILNLGAALQSTIATVSLLVGAGSIVYAIIRYQFLDIRLIVRQSLVYTVTSGLLVGMYMLIISQLGKITRSIFGRDAPVIDVAFIIVALIFFQPVMNYVDNVIKRFFIRDKSDFRNIAEQFSRGLATIFDLDELKNNVSTVLREQMLVERVSFCLRDWTTGSYELSSAAETQPPHMKFLSTDSMIEKLREHQKPVSIDELIAAPLDGSECWEELKHGSYELIVPLQDRRSVLGFVALSPKVSGYSYSYEDMTTLNILGNQLVTAVSNAWLYEESLEKQRLEKEMALARQIQNDLLPKSLPCSEKFEFAAFTEPARQVGGDYFDFLNTERNTIGVVVADASGKGMPAALLISQLQATLRSEVRNKRSLSDMVANANYLISTSTSPEKFVTLFFGELDEENLEFSYCNAGHNYPFVIRQDGSIEYFETGGLLMGAFPKATYESNKFQLVPGDLVFFYTDGLNEAHDAKSEEYGEGRLVKFIKDNRHLPANDLTELVISEIRSFSASTTPEDDMTVVVLKINNV